MKLGKIILQRKDIMEFVRDPKGFPHMKAILECVIPVDVHTEVAFDTIEYTCYSENFEDIPTGSFIPYYEVSHIPGLGPQFTLTSR